MLTVRQYRTLNAILSTLVFAGVLLLMAGIVCIAHGQQPTPAPAPQNTYQDISGPAVTPPLAPQAAPAVPAPAPQAVTRDAFTAAWYAAARTDKPLIVVVSQPGCLPCEELKLRYAAALRERGVVLFLDAVADRDILARHHIGVTCTPTVIHYDATCHRYWGVRRPPYVMIGLGGVLRWLGRL